MNVVYAMDEATLFDSFFNYLQQIEVFRLLECLDPKNQQRKNVPFFQIVLVFLMKVVGAIKKMDQMTDLLLTDELLMSVCGFNAYQVKNGSCYRGTRLRKTPIPEIRGSLCVDLEVRGKQSTWQMYRRKLKVLNRNKRLSLWATTSGFFHRMKSLCWPMSLFMTRQKSSISPENKSIPNTQSLP